MQDQETSHTWAAAARPLQRVSAVDELAQVIRAAILDGRVRSGTQLREIELCGAFGVARNTVRSALQSLVHEGLAQHEPHRGVFVRSFRAADVEDIFVLRGALESEAAYLICTKGLPTGNLEDALRRLESLHAAPWRELMDADLAVHSALVGSVGSPRFDQAFDATVSQMRWISAQPLDRPANEDVAEQHRIIVEAVLSGDAARAVNEVRAHLELARSRMLRGLAEQDPVAAPWS